MQTITNSKVQDLINFKSEKIKELKKYICLKYINITISKYQSKSVQIIY